MAAKTDGVSDIQSDDAILSINIRLPVTVLCVVFYFVFSVQKASGGV